MKNTHFLFIHNRVGCPHRKGGVPPWVEKFQNIYIIDFQIYTKCYLKAIVKGKNMKRYTIIFKLEAYIGWGVKEKYKTLY